MFRRVSLFGFITVLFVLAISQPVLGAYSAGDTIANFTLKDHFTNEDVSLYDYPGHIIVLDFFAHWCGPCRTASSELEPYIAQYYHDLGGNPSSIPVKLISVNMQSNAESQTNDYIADYGLQTAWEDPRQIAFGSFSPSWGIPHIAIINGAAGTNYGQWEALYTSAGYESGMYNYFLTIIDRVEKDSGSLQVTLSPSMALDMGAKWNFDGGEWFSSGATISGLLAGDHTVNYKAINKGWQTLLSENVTITPGETTKLDRIYTKIGDINDDSFINLVDFAMLAEKWGFSGECTEDLDRNGEVGSGDLNLLANYWLNPKWKPNDADAYVRGGTHSGSNFGSLVYLIAKNDSASSNVHQSYLRFNYDSKAGTKASNAILKLTPIAIKANQTLRISLTEDSKEEWFEANINWSNKPMASGLEIDFSSNDLVRNKPYLIDVTELLNQAMNTNKIATFQIEAVTQSSSGDNRFASREHPTVEWRPALEVEMVHAGDIDGDGTVNMVDFDLLSSQWQSAGSADIAPGSGDGIVDLADLKILAENWLYQNAEPVEN